MELKAESATEDDIDFAWKLYSTFVKNNLFSEKEWLDQQEKKKFLNLWNESSCYRISVDGERIGFSTIKFSDKNVDVENVFLVEEWQNRKVTSHMFGSLVEEWRKKGMTINCQILDGAPNAEKARSVLKKVGLEAKQIHGNFELFSSQGG